MNKPQKLKMRIILRWDLSPSASLVAVGHAVLGTYLTYREDELMKEWEKTSFVNILHRSCHQEHWNWCKTLGEHRVFTESSLGNMEVSLGFRITENMSHLFRDIPLA
jgi:hypothetical protein